jgi:hypothetical protein
LSSSDLSWQSTVWSHLQVAGIHRLPIIGFKNLYNVL